MSKVTKTKKEQTKQKFHNPYRDLGLHTNADDSQINRAYGGRMLRVSVDLENVYSRGHAELQMLSDATLILRDESMRAMLDRCLIKDSGVQDINGGDIPAVQKDTKDEDVDKVLNTRDCDVLGVPDDAEDEVVKAAYATQTSRWAGFERYRDLVVTCLRHARDQILNANLKARKDSASPKDNKPSTLLAPTTS